MGFIDEANGEECDDGNASPGRQLGAFPSSEARPPKSADGLEPPEDLFDALADTLTDLVARCLRRASINGRAALALQILSYVRGHVAHATGLDEAGVVISLVGGNRDALRARDVVFEHGDGVEALGDAVRAVHAQINQQAVAILHQAVQRDETAPRKGPPRSADLRAPPAPQRGRLEPLAARPLDALCHSDVAPHVQPPAASWGLISVLWIESH